MPTAASARRHDDFLPLAALADRQPIARRQHEARVMDRRPELVQQRKRLLEPGEARVAMHEDRVEPGLRPAEHLALALRLRLHLQDLAHRADHERPRPRRLDALEQRHELEAQRPAAERKRLEDDGVGLHGVVRREQQVAPRLAIRVVDRERNRRRAAA